MSSSSQLSDPLADVIREAGGVRYGDVSPERLAAAIREGVLAKHLIDIPAEALGFHPLGENQYGVMVFDRREGPIDE